MVIRNNRLRREKLVARLIAKDENLLCDHGQWEDRSDNVAELTDLRRRYGDSAVKTVSKGVAGMGGSDVYVNGRWAGWFGGV